MIAKTNYPASTCLELALQYALSGLESETGVPEDTYHSAYYLTVALRSQADADILSANVVSDGVRYYLK